MNDDVALLRRYADARDEAAFAELVRRHLALVYGAALRQLDGAAHRAEDVTQSVFTDLAHKAAALARRDDLIGWLYTSTHFAAAKLKRGEQRRQRREQEAYIMHELLSGSPAEADWERLRPVLDDAMHELGDRDREVILQRFFQGRRFAEVGEQLGLSEDAARMRVDRAMEKLRALLARRQITSTTAALAVALANQPAVAVPAGLAATVTGAALTSATTAAGSVATVLQFMTTSKMVATVAGVALLAGAFGVATHEMSARQAAETSLGAVTGEATQLEGRLRDVQQRATTATQALHDSRASLAALETPPSKPPASAATPVDPYASGREFLAQHPEARELWDERERANVAAKLTPIYRLMNLTAEQRDRLEGIILGGMSGTTTFGVAGITLRREATMSRAEAEAQMQDLLGAEGYARFQALSRVVPTFDLTARLASALYRVEPLNPTQTERVMQIFADASPAAKSGPPRIDWEEIAAEAGNVLSPTQLAALTVVQRNFEYQQAMQKIATPPVTAALPPKNAATPAR